MIRLYEITSVIAAFQFTLLAIFLFSLKNGRRSSNRFLSLFFISNAIFTVDFLMGIYRYQIYEFCPHLFYMGFPFAFLIGPSLYLYIDSLTDRNFSINKRLLIHLIPFISIGFYLTFRFYIHDTNVKQALLRSGDILNYTEALIIYGGLYFTMTGYLAISSLKLQEIYSKTQENDTTKQNHYLSWLIFILKAFVALWLFRFFEYVNWAAKHNDMSFVHPLYRIFLFCFSTLILYKCLKQPEIFVDILTGRKYSRSRLTPSDMQRYITQITSYMENKKPYLVPSLSLADFAEGVSIQARDVSQVINQSLGRNFFDFVNTYRIEEAKRLLRDASHSKHNMMQILLDVDFNSKSVFNRVFKEYTGMTPTELRRHYRIESAF